LIYSHQPTAAPAIVTVNGAVRWYHELPAGPSTSTLRDIQLAAQVDRRLGDIPRLGQTVLTFAIYYQWMKDDALVHLASSSDAPGGSGSFPLPGTKGHIAVLQGKWSIPLSDVIKVPVSMTWATRHELIKENDVRAQIGLTLDLDSLFQ
jgi:hypothetical protein